MSEYRQVQVWGKPYTVAVNRTSKTVWEAVGDYNGETIRVKNSSASSAAKLWAETRYRGN